MKKMAEGYRQIKKYAKFRTWSRAAKRVGQDKRSLLAKQYAAVLPDGGTMFVGIISDGSVLFKVYASFPQGQGGSNGGADNTGVRVPDFYSLNVTVAIPNPITATVVGWSGSISIDRHGQIFMSPFGVSVGKSALIASASLTANWMLQSNKPTANEIYNFLSRHGISVGGGYYGGVNWAISPANSGTKNALGIGLYTPQVGASYNYTPEYSIFNKQ